MIPEGLRLTLDDACRPGSAAVPEAGQGSRAYSTSSGSAGARIVSAILSSTSARTIHRWMYGKDAESSPHAPRSGADLSNPL